MINNIETGAKYKGNVNGATVCVEKIENGWVHYTDCKTGKSFMYGLEAFRRCNLTALDKQKSM